MTGQRVYLDFMAELDPLTVRPVLDDGKPDPDFLAVVMPMRV